MLGNVYVNQIHAMQCLYIHFVKVFPILSISLLYPTHSLLYPNPSRLAEQLGRKDFSMEQLPIDFYMLLYVIIDYIRL